MSKTRPPYTPEFRRQMTELVRAGRSAEELVDMVEVDGVHIAERRKRLRGGVATENLRIRLNPASTTLEAAPAWKDPLPTPSPQWVPSADGHLMGPLMAAFMRDLGLKVTGSKHGTTTA